MLLRSMNSQWKNAKIPMFVKIPSLIENNILKSYENIPSKNIEFGGIMCGRFQNNDAIITKISWIPSVRASKNDFFFDNNILTRSNLYCGKDSIIGMWHTHSKDFPLPSDVDRKTTNDLGIIGCVLSDSLKCFKGSKNIPVRKI